MRRKQLGALTAVVVAATASGDGTAAAAAAAAAGRSAGVAVTAAADAGSGSGTVGHLQQQQVCDVFGMRVVGGVALLAEGVDCQ